MEVQEAIETLRSIREYKDTKVEEEKIQKVLEAARLAPSALNKQPWKYVVIKEKEMLDKINYACNQTWFAPVMIIGCVDPAESYVREDGEGYWKMDLAVSMHNLMLSAWEEGLGTCWVTAFSEKEIKEFLDIPHYMRVLALTPLGYPDQKKKAVLNRKPMDEMVFYEVWGRKNK
jgi:nitroreductase